MTLSTENILLLGSLLLFASILASKSSSRFGIPVLLFFLAVGMLAGSDGPGGIYFDDPKIAQFLGVTALTFILFSGGLDTKLETIRPAIRNGISLSTIGVLITAVSVGTFSHLVLHMDWMEGMLLGAIVSSTDAAAVFSILRTRSLGLKGNIRPILEFESGSNDPMAYFLTLSFIEYVNQPETSLWLLVPQFLKSMILGGVCGYLFGRIMIFTLNKIALDIEGLYPVLLIALVFLAFSLTDLIGGNGFLAVYLSAVILGNSNFIHKKSLIRFYDGSAWLMQIVMFLTLGLLVFPTKLLPIAGQGVLVSLFLILIARPVAVFVSTMFSSDLNTRKKWFISWVGLRGAAPIVFATYPLLSGVKYADTLFNLVFFISVTSVLLQGTTLPVVASLLHVSVPQTLKRKYLLDVEMSDQLKSELIAISVPPGAAPVGKAIVQLELPHEGIIALIHRKGKYLTPRGGTIIEEGDSLLVLADEKENIRKIYESLELPIPAHFQELS